MGASATRALCTDCVYSILWFLQASSVPNRLLARPFVGLHNGGGVQGITTTGFVVFHSGVCIHASIAGEVIKDKSTRCCGCSTAGAGGQRWELPRRAEPRRARDSPATAATGGWVAQPCAWPEDRLAGAPPFPAARGCRVRHVRRLGTVTRQHPNSCVVSTAPWQTTFPPQTPNRNRFRFRCLRGERCLQRRGLNNI